MTTTLAPIRQARALPRLTACLQWQGILSNSEADAAIRAIRRGDEFACEAVNHYGGPTRLVRDAIRNRHATRRLYASRGRRLGES